MISGQDFSSSYKPKQPRKIPLLRIVLIGALGWWVYTSFITKEKDSSEAETSSSSSSQEIKKEAPKKQTKPTKKTLPKKTTPKANEPFSISTRTFFSGTKIHTVQQHPITPMTSAKDKHFIHPHINYLIQKYSQHFNPKDTLEFKITYPKGRKTASRIEIQRPFTYTLKWHSKYKDWMDSTGCLQEQQCIKYPNSRFKFSKNSGKPFWIFKGKKAQDKVHPIAPGKVIRSFKDSTGHNIIMYHGKQLYAHYNGFAPDSTPPKPGQTLGINTTLGLLTKSKKVGVKLELEGSTISFRDLWKKAYPLNSTKLKKFWETP